jgi:hypothetical protein
LLAGPSLATAQAPPALAARADHTIVFFHSIAGVSMGESAASARRRLGPPGTIQRTTGGAVDWSFDHDDLTVELTHGRVDFVSVSSRSYRGPRGVHVGAPASAARQVYDGAPCGTLSFQCTFSIGSKQVTIQHGNLLTIIDFARRHGTRNIASISLLLTTAA